MIRFDPTARKDWQARGVTDLTVEFYQSGCAGTKVRVTESAPASDLAENAEDTWTISESDGLTVHTKRSENEILERARLTRVNGKWIFASDAVKSRCGCGSSFSFEPGTGGTGKHHAEKAEDSSLTERIAQAKSRFANRSNLPKY